MKKLILAGLFSLICLTGCAPNASNQEYSSADLKDAAVTVEGKIVSKRMVQVAGKSGVGGLAGTAAGAVAGSTIGGSTAGHWLGGIGGAVVGGLAGSAIEKGMTSQKVFEYIVRIDRREKRAERKTLVTVLQSDANFHPGEKVFVILADKPRIVKDMS